MSTFVLKEYVVNRKRIGKGSFSTIYKGYSTKTNKHYAIKEIVFDKKQKKTNIKREFSLLKKLNHPNIIKLHDVIIDTNYNNIYFIIDYYPKGDLAQFLKHRPLKEKYCKKYLKQLACGLKYLLSNNILHRDLKPQNILLTNGYDIKLTDFGFARIINKNEMINTLCGSPMYMAPEIINKRDYDIKSDLWSVGIIMYEMLYGGVPYRVNNFIELIKKINQEQITFDEKIETTKECNDLLKNLLQKNPSRRITWDEFFNHSWFLTDVLLNETNNLLEISFSNNLPNINKYNVDERQFCSFVHQSIIQENKSNSQTEDLEMNFLDSIEDYESANEDDNDNDDNNDNEDISSYEDFTEKTMNLTASRESLSSEICRTHIPIPTQAIPINNIRNKRNRYVDDGFILINSKDIYRNSEPIANKKTITASFKEYLYSSIDILKQSYNYISNKSI